ncbi:hypothetical protein TNCV_1076621 [Trichonephila clavipes]|uniref:Uncharacterized protein n=1 Tax=Trichonephila clavipes TaxID=2585209 RepID=A0A8X6UY66_TRICX|nr:hypothetical protein TNCV_1076621 [Trichonephila clavipes]
MVDTIISNGEQGFGYNGIVMRVLAGKMSVRKITLNSSLKSCDPQPLVHRPVPVRGSNGAGPPKARGTHANGACEWQKGNSHPGTDGSSPKPCVLACDSGNHPHRPPSADSRDHSLPPPWRQRRDRQAIPLGIVRRSVM